MLSNQIFWGSILITVCVLFHVISLLLLTKIVKFLDFNLKKIISRREFVSMLILMFSVMYVILTHIVEMLIWAVTFVALGEFENIVDSLYFSIITATTLGYGDMVLSESYRLLSGFEAIGGLILFSVSTAFFIRMIGILFDLEGEQNKYTSNS